MNFGKKKFMRGFWGLRKIALRLIKVKENCLRLLPFRKNALYPRITTKAF